MKNKPYRISNNVTQNHSYENHTHSACCATDIPLYCL
jgi:hypothetical protein